MPGAAAAAVAVVARFVGFPVTPVRVAVAIGSFGQCSMHNAQCSMFNVQCSMFNVQCSMFNDHTTIDHWTFVCRSAPGVTRTPGKRYRKPLLYPPELQGLVRGGA